MIGSPAAPSITQSAIDNHQSSISMPTPRELLDRLDSRHDELIRKLDELNAQIEQTLAEFAKSRPAPPQPLDTTADSTAIGKIVSRRAA